MRKGKPIFDPMPGKIAVRLLEEQTQGGLILPNDVKSRVLGEVIAIGGDEEEGDFYDLAIGDVVMFGVNSGVKVGVDEITTDGGRRRHEVLIFRTAEILTKVRWEEPDGPT